MSREQISACLETRRIALRNRDAHALALSHAEDGVIDSPTAGIVRGRDAIEEVYNAWFRAFPDFEMGEEDLLVDGEKAALLVTASGTHRGEFCGLPATGKRFKIRVVSLFRFKGDEIHTERRIYDFTGLLLQIGVLKAKPGI